MQEQINQLNTQVNELKKEVESLTALVKTLSDTSYKTARREIINREVQFMQNVYRKDGTLVTTINT